LRVRDPKEDSVKTILQRIVWWKKRLAKMSPAMVKHRDIESRAQMRVWALAMARFIHSAAKYGFVRQSQATFIQDSLGDWENTELATRLAVVGFVVRTLDRVTADDSGLGDRILGDFAIGVSPYRKIIGMVVHADDLPRAGRQHASTRGISRAEATHGTRSKKARVLPRKVSRLQ